jgi:hypothetical protein
VRRRPCASDNHAHRALPASHGSCHPTALVHQNALSVPAAADRAGAAALSATVPPPASSAAASRRAPPSPPRWPDARPPRSVRNLHSGSAPVPAPPDETLPRKHGSSAGRSCHAAELSPRPCGTAPRSAWLADSSAPATPRLLAAASCPPSLAPSPQSESLLAEGTLKGATSNVVSGGHF